MGVSKGRINNYEGLFLISQAVAHNLGEAVAEVESVLARGESNIIAFSKWDERRLAYEINKSKRGVYFLVYFACDPANMDAIERQCNLSEKIMRVMFTRADHLTDDEMKATDSRVQLSDEIKVRSEEIEKREAEEAETTSSTAVLELAGSKDESATGDAPAAEETPAPEETPAEA